MTPDTVIDLFRDTMLLIILIVSVLVVPGLLVGLVVSIFQAATQINEQTLSFLPRLLTTFAMIIVAGAWILARLIDFTQRLITQIPMMLG